MLSAIFFSSAGCELISGFEEGTPRGNQDAALASLQVSVGELAPPFDPDTTEYTVALGLDLETLVVTASAAAPSGTTIEIAGIELDSGQDSPPLELSLGDNTISVVVTPAGAAARTYTIGANRGALLAQQAYVKASNTDADDGFGSALAADDNTLVVGAFQEDGNGTGTLGDQANNDALGSGAVYVYFRQATQWSQQAYLKASNTDPNDAFGFAVSIDGDTIVVGAPQESGGGTGIDGNQADNSAAGAGAVYVFVRDGTVWSQQAFIKASNTDAMDEFGTAVSVSGDTLVVGAPGEASSALIDQANNGAPRSGAVYVFTRSGTMWSQQAYIKASNLGSDDQFGARLSLNGETLAVGAANEDSASTGINGVGTDDDADGSGAAYVFVRSGNAWEQQAYIKASNTDSSDEFGASVVLSGNTLAVGAALESGGGGGGGGGAGGKTRKKPGGCFVFVRDGGDWAQQAYIKASNPDPTDQFGGGVALDGDVLVVSTQFESSGAEGVSGDESDDTAPSSGAAYLFGRSGTSWSQILYVKASNTARDDLFGVAVDVSGGTVFVGAAGEDSAARDINGDQGDNNATSAGAAYVLR